MRLRAPRFYPRSPPLLAESQRHPPPQWRLDRNEAELPGGHRRLLRELSRLNGKSERSISKRELIDTGNDKRFVRRDGDGQFKEGDDVGKTRRRPDQPAKTKVKVGEGDKGDR